ncbi:MAG: hypothetical protein FVQ85_02940 [Planctomycetes bacterium]|nr:hypothetical protein [Planctomycetota bacterium]
MAKSKTKKTGTKSDCEGVQELKAIAAKIAEVSLPAGTPEGIKGRLVKMSARLITQADNIQAALVRSTGSIERAAKRKARLEKRIADATAQLTKLQ